MGRHRNTDTGVVVSVDDSKDDRYDIGWESADSEPKKAPAKKAAASRKSSEN